MKPYFNDYYRAVLEELGADYLEPSGWHNCDRSQLKLDDSSYSNLHKIKIKPDLHNFILISTGSFYPLDEGHFKMMQSAKQLLHSQSKHVSACVFSPHTTSWLKDKNLDSHLSPEVLRKHNINDSLKDVSWACADFWAMHQNTEPNFTDVCDHIKEVVIKHLHVLPQKVQPVYVFGSDNAYYCHAFLKKGLCICVLKLGYEKQFYEMKRTYETSSHHLFTTEIEATLVHPESASIAPALEGQYCIRDDSCMYPKKFRTKNLVDYKRALLSLLKEVMPYYSFYLIDANIQAAYAHKLSKRTPCINLDAVCYKQIDTYLSKNLSITRVFSLNDSQIQPLFLHHRENDPLSYKLSKIPPGQYTLIDDEIVTGTTIRKVIEMGAPLGIEITNTVSLLHKTIPQLTNVVETIDLRDFLPLNMQQQIPFSGLSVKSVSGAIIRVPYWDPHIDLFSRASIPFDKHEFFRAELAKLNKRLAQRSS